jgi:glycosyltransferase involved in cell wall biosynthesis
MSRPLSVICAVTNDLIQDQRMDRICGSLVDFSFKVSLWGRKKKRSLPLHEKIYLQRRLPVFFQKGPAFYLEYNIRFFIAASLARPDIIYAVDTDTLPGAWLASRFTGARLVYDAHEYFTEVPELQHHTLKKKIWNLVEQFVIPRADLHITVGSSLAHLLTERYKKIFYVIRNVPELTRDKPATTVYEKPYILYQGVLNEGRGLEAMIEAMPMIPDIDLRIVGWGDIGSKLRKQASASEAADRIHFMGWMTPPQLRQITAGALLGINLLDDKSLSYRYSLANKFFDYMHGGVPSLNMDFPEYRFIIHQYPVGILIHDLNHRSLAQYISEIIVDEPHMLRMKRACEEARQTYCWQQESLILEKLFMTFKTATQ